MSWTGLTASIIVFLFGGFELVLLGYSQAKLNRLKPQPLSAHVEWAGEAGASRRLLLVGDSRVAYWPLQPAPNWRIGRIGFPGEAAVNIAPAIHTILVEARPYAVVIQAGGNDATAAVFQSGEARSKTLAQAVEALMAIGESARAAGAQRVIVLSLVPPIEPELWKRALMGTTPYKLMSSMGPEIRRCTEAHRFEFLDADALFRDSKGELRRDYRRDALHWSDAAYAALNAVLYKRLEP